MAEYSPCSPSPTSFMEFEPSLLNRFKDKFSPSDWESLEKHLDDERKLSILKNALFAKLSRAQTRLEKESKMNVRDKCQLIGEMADYLYELQLVEHALKSPMLNIAKIIFSINPKRRVDKDSIQIKQKPTKKRKNELGGLVGEMSDELNKISVREAKLLAVSQVHRHHQEERFEEIDAFANVGPKRGRLKRRTIPTTGRSVKDLVAVVATDLLPTQSDNLRDMDDEQQKYAEFDKSEDVGETEAVNFLLMVAQNPSTLSDEGQQRGSTNSPQRTESAGNSATELLHSPPRTRATKKRSRETDLGSEPNESTGSSNVKSPQKRQASAMEHQQQWNEEDEIEQMEYGEENLERKGKRQLDEAEPTYCLCERVSFGEMICCDYELCSVEWFHFACVNIKSKPKGKKWFCPLCRHNDKANMLKPELLHKLDLMRHRSY